MKDRIHQLFSISFFNPVNLAAGSRGAGRLLSEAKLLRREDAGLPQWQRSLSRSGCHLRNPSSRDLAAPSETAAVALKETPFFAAICAHCREAAASRGGRAFGGSGQAAHG